MKIIQTSLTILFVIGVMACGHKTEQHSEDLTNIEKTLVADTIQYTVTILPDNQDQAYVYEELKGLDREKLVKSLFESVYKHQAKAYNYLTGASMNLEEVKEMEIKAAYDRDLAAQIHFWERWEYNPKTISFKKDIIKVMLAYEIRNDDDELIGYRAGVIIEMKR